MANRVQEFFAPYEVMAEENADKITGLTAALVYDFSKSGDGFWTISFIDGKMQPIVNEAVDNPDMKITASFEDFRDVRTGKLDPQEAFASKRLIVEGDTSVTMRLGAAGIG